MYNIHAEGPCILVYVDSLAKIHIYRNIERLAREERAEAWGVRWRCCKLTMKLVAEFWSPRPGLRLPPLVGSGVRGYFYCSSFCSAFLRFAL